MPEPGPSTGELQPIYPAIPVESFFNASGVPPTDLTPGSPSSRQPLSAVIICTVASILYPLGVAANVVKSLQINFDQGFPGTTTTTTSSTTTTPTTTSNPTTTSSTTTSSTTTSTTTTLALEVVTANSGPITVWIWSVAANGYVPFGTYAPGSAPLNWSPTDTDRLYSLADIQVSAQIPGDGVRIIYS